MHLIIPYAVSHAPNCSAAFHQLRLPNLQQLLGCLSAQPIDPGDAFSLSPPHERALAQGLGIAAADGQIPWAAWQAQQHPQLANKGGGWAFITLCQWQTQSGHVTMRHLPIPDLSPAESDALLAAMQRYFAEDGLDLYPDQCGRYLAHGDVFAGLATASPERVVGRSVAPWLPEGKQAAALRRLQNEMQMLLYSHPLYDERAARAATPVNSFWLHGSGALPTTTTPTQPASAAPTVVNTLRDPALSEDWSAWSNAWAQLDACQIKGLLQASASGQPVQLTLCGERHAQSWQTQRQSAWQKLKRVFGTARLPNLPGEL